MKKLRYILPIIALLLFACDSDDDGFYNTKYVQAAELVNVEGQNVYQVGETVYVNAFIPRLLPEPGQTTLLDVRETTGNASSFSFSYALERKNAAGEWEAVEDISSLYVPGGAGSAEALYYVQGNLLYDATADEYQYRGGITLPQTGEYRFNFSNETSNYSKVGLVSNSPDNNVILHIFSSSSSLDSSGMYNFTVTN
ncbi:MAG: hypothetical protein EOO48_01390 [Flavobacterium sp.]|nr:MAG: hypothetical protein EOO48_01390 [Flavobacterium sp.]